MITLLLNVLVANIIMIRHSNFMHVLIIQCLMIGMKFIDTGNRLISRPTAKNKKSENRFNLLLQKIYIKSPAC